jgi:hypothetical protein
MSDNDMVDAVFNALEANIGDVGLNPDPGQLEYMAETAVEAVRDVIRMRLASRIPVKERQQLLMMLFVTGDKFGFCHGSDTAACWLRDAFQQLQEEEARREAPQEGA